MSIDKTYKELIHLLHEVSTVQGIKSILSWDQRVNMPPEGAEARSRQNAYLSEVLHEKKSDPRLGKLLDTLESKEEQLDFDQKTVVRETRRKFEQENRLPEEFISERARHTTEAYQVWVKARETDDFEMFEPYLEKNVDFARQEAEYLGYEESPYNTLIDKFDPGITESRIESLFNNLRSELVPLKDEILEMRNEPDREQLITSKTWSRQKQEELGMKIVKKFGYDTDAGRLDTTVHPFCSGYKGDVRITTRYNESDPFDSWTSIMHECGHALYEQGLDPETWGTPLSEPVGMAVHESQSRMWENMVGRSEPFWGWIWPEVCELFPDQTGDLELGTIQQLVRSVEPGYIRVEADEVTYNLHIILRFELERQLVKGELEVSDVPAKWNALMEELLGLTPPDHRRGVLQDMHWSGGSFGYFPSYALGNLISAQLFEQAKKEVGDFENAFLEGEFSPLLTWLRENIHQKGKRYRTEDLVEEVTGNKLSVEPFLNHLRVNYLPDIAG